MVMITMMMMLTMMTMIEVDIEIIVGSSSRQNRHRSNKDGGSTGLFLPTSIPTTSMLPARVAIVQLFNYFKTTVFYFSFSLPYFEFYKLNMNNHLNTALCSFLLLYKDHFSCTLSLSSTIGVFFFSRKCFKIFSLHTIKMWPMTWER